MDSIFVTNHQEYIICDRNLTIVQFSQLAQNFLVKEAVIRQDIRDCLPEMVGLETTCEEILAGQESFTLEAILRHQQSGKLLYFDLTIEKIEQYIAIFLQDVTDVTLLQQSSVQRLNEVEIKLSKLQRFEYCTNKIIASMKDVLLITSVLP